MTGGPGVFGGFTIAPIAVPEPSTFGLAAVGVVGLIGGVATRRRKS